MLADLPKGAMLLADKGYDANALRAAVSTQDAWANIPPKTNRKDPICFSPYLYKARNLIERFFNKIKHYRRIATRYDKFAENPRSTETRRLRPRVWTHKNVGTSVVA